MTSTDPSEAATWEGARRARIRRSLKLTVQERLEVLEALTETSASLMEIGRAARAGEGRPSGHSNEPDR